MRASISREADAVDLDLLRVRSISPSVGANLSDGSGGDKRGEEEGDGTHFGFWDCCVSGAGKRRVSEDLESLVALDRSEKGLR